MKILYQQSISAILLGIALLNLYSSQVNAQQELYFNGTVQNPFYVNPVAMGFNDLIQIEFAGRTQWTGYEGAPQTFIATVQSPISFSKSKKVLGDFSAGNTPFFAEPERQIGKTKHVLGGKLYSDAIGPFLRSGLNLNYGIHLPLTKRINFGIGLGLGWSNFRINSSRVTLYQQDDIAYQQFFINTSHMNTIDAQGGLVFYNKRLSLGLSSSQFFNQAIQFANTSTESRLQPHYYLTAKYLFDMGPSFNLEPTAIIKYVKGSPLSVDAGFRVIYKKSVWVGLQYRYQNAMIFQIGSNLIKNLYISYAYEHNIGDLSTVRNGTHEVHLGMWIGRNRNTEKEIEKSKEEGEKNKH